ncbi:MAG TPA: type II toxin-antitoxin system VapC family toxin [Sphingomonas sp.]|uniref:type II toxin-antitoxin system VapC family toxin n=1 Tax=Sphingomonas sp. TaxID=28214 RepID=UPI002EDB75DE
MILLDTNVVVWAGLDDPRLGGSARRLIDHAAGGQGLGMASITPWEMAMLVSKNRLTLGRPVVDWVRAFLARPGVEFVPLTPEIGMDAGSLPSTIHGDPSDRIIIATSRALGCPVLTGDGLILRYAQAGLLSAIDARR